MSVVKIPSTTYKGLVWFLLTVPLIRISGSCPGCPELTIDKPATLPCKEATGFTLGLSATMSPSILTIDPAKSLFLAVPYPTTTTSSSAAISGFSVTLTVV